MTKEDIESACRSVQVGWSHLDGRAIVEQAPSAYCNGGACGSLARMAGDAGATEGELAAALKSKILGDPDPLRSISIAAKSWRAA